MKRLAALAVLALLTGGPPPALRADAKEEKVAALVKELSAADESARLRAALALGNLGKPAVGPLAEALASKDADARYYAVWALGLIGPDAKDKAPDVAKMLADKSEQVRRKAAFALGRVAPDPNVAVPSLVKAMADDSADVRSAAAEACAGFGAGSVPPLLDAVKSSEPRVRLTAAQALGHVGPDAEKAVPGLAALLRDGDDDVVTEAALALAKVGKASLPALTDALKSDRGFVRARAVEAVGKVEGTEAVNALVDALKSPRPDVRRLAARTLGELKVTDKLVILSLGEVLRKDEDDRARQQAYTVLAQSGLFAKLAAPDLYAALADDNPYLRGNVFTLCQNLGLNPAETAEKFAAGKDARARLNAAALLVALGLGQGEYLTLLSEALKEKDAALRYQAAFGLAYANQGPGDTIPVLLEALKQGKPVVRERAVTVLIRLQGDKAVDAALREALKDEAPEVRWQAAIAVARQMHDAKKTLPILAEMLRDPDPLLRQQALQGMRGYREDAVPYHAEALRDRDVTVRQVAVAYLAELGPALAKKALPALAGAARKDPDFQVRDQALWLVLGMGEDAIPAMIELLKGGDSQVQQNVMGQLQQFKAKAKAAAPVLVEILKGGGDDERWLAAQTLGQIGPAAKDALPALREAAEKDPSDVVKSHARSALPLIEMK